MREPRDTCREVTLPSGEPIRVRGADDMSPEAIAALGEIVDAVRAWHAAEHPPDDGAEELWTRIDQTLGGLTLREAARQAGVPFSALFRVAQGRMPEGEQLAAIENWLARHTGHTGS